MCAYVYGCAYASVCVCVCVCVSVCVPVYMYASVCVCVDTFLFCQIVRKPFEDKCDSEICFNNVILQSDMFF